MTDYKTQYQKQGYVVLRGYFDPKEIDRLMPPLQRFHEKWKIDNAEFYASHAINSYNLTGFDLLDDQDKMILFQFIASRSISDLVETILDVQALFMGTQLFFDPHNSQQSNYWHRDIQYSGLSLDQQKQTIKRQNPLHFRIPTRDEPGIELVPGTHTTWDTAHELRVRHEQDGHKNHAPLSRGKTIALNKGDLLIFSANMIHRGLYGKDRLTLDLLFSDAAATMKKFIQENSLPALDQLRALNAPFPFKNSLDLTADR